GLLRLLEESVRQLVLDGDLRQQIEDARVPETATGHGAVSSPVGLQAGRAAWRCRLRWRLRAPLLVAGARLRAQPGRALLVIVGVAASNAILVGVIGGSLIARDRAVQRAVAALPPPERSFRVDAFGLPPDQDYARADRTVRAALAPLSPRP